MRILYICQRVPYPPNRGDKIAAYHAIRQLARHHSVTVAALAESRAERDEAGVLTDEGITLLVELHPPARARAHALLAVAGSTPFSVAYFRSAALARRIREAAAAHPFDVVVAFSSSMAAYAGLLPETPLIADFVDLDSQKWALYAGHTPWPRALLYAEESRRLLAWERDVAARARATLVRTNAELEDCRRLLPSGRFEILSNGVDLERFRPAPTAPTSPDVVFTGVMDYFPNVRGATFFAEEVFPRIRREIPEATFTIVGARPDRAVRDLAWTPGITVTGTVPDVRTFLERATVAVAPLALARGIQNKVLEALATGTPAVVSSPVARGIDAEPGEGFLVADAAEDVARTVVRLLREPAEAAALGRRGRALVERRYVWEHNLSRLEDLLAETAPGAAPAAASA